MANLSTPFRHMLTACGTVTVFTIIAFFVLRPIEWRMQLLHLLARAFVAFTQYLGTNGPGWIISVVGSSIFTIVATVVIVGLIRGRAAMSQHWGETAAIALLAFVGQIVLLYGPIYMRKVTQTVYDDHQMLVAKANAPMPKCQTCPTCPSCPKVRGATGGKSVAPTQIVARYYNVQHANVNGKRGTVFLIEGVTNNSISPVDVLLTCNTNIRLLEGGG